MLFSGVLYQADAAEAKLSPPERLRAAVAQCQARHGWRPGHVLVQANGYEWPAEIDGVWVIPSRAIAYSTYLLLVKSVTEESHVVASVG